MRKEGEADERVSASAIPGNQNPAGQRSPSCRRRPASRGRAVVRQAHHERQVRDSLIQDIAGSLRETK